MLWHIAMIVSFVNYIIGVWIMCIIQLWRCWGTWLQVCVTSTLSIVMYADGVLWESTTRLFLQAVIVVEKKSLIWYILICVVLCHLFIWEVLSIMWQSSMFVQGRPGSTSWGAINLSRYCRGSKSSKLLWRTILGGVFENPDNTTRVIIPPSISLGIEFNREFGDNWQYRTILSRKEWHKLRTDPFLEQREPCYMMNHFLYLFGHRHAVQMYSCWLSCHLCQQCIVIDSNMS